MKSVKLLISGKVQGVFFRESAKNRAIDLGLFGWVKNTDDGKVEMVLQGDDNGVNEMIDWSRQGPPSAEVEKVDIIGFDHSLRSNDFKIKK